MEFVLLGGMAVLSRGTEIDLGPARQRCVLAALAADAGHVVSVDRLTRRVWGDEPPLRARATLLNYLSRLRLLLVRSEAVARRPGGYVLEVDRSSIDLFRFRDLCTRARSHDDREAADLLRQALELWRGEALTGIDGDWATGERDRLHHERLAAERDLTDALLRLGHAEDLIAPLTDRTARWPLDEHLAGQLMLALHRSGRTADALAHHRDLRDRLVEQLGTEPGTALRDLHQRILEADRTLAP
ncbi:AfsR/SARP family transcriptional regulator [Lentzea sp. NPDC003310]|uniref:AfsR/SARP family transcriptional regulator n=1 Tax=Lentzea sp. NPDC003310 TaxID=3154447 RepID=UPI0033B2D672